MFVDVVEKKFVKLGMLMVVGEDELGYVKKQILVKSIEYLFEFWRNVFKGENCWFFL